MKLLSYILSIYLVVLSCLPCADMEVSSMAHKAEDIASDHDGHPHDKKNDLCSPFCACNCCGTQILSYVPEVSFNFPIVSKIIKSVLPAYKSIFYSNFYGSIWQPPQIV